MKNLLAEQNSLPIPDNIKSFINQIPSSENSSNYDFFEEVFNISENNIINEYLNNRIGDYLKQEEANANNIIKTNLFKSGDVLVYEEDDGMYKFVLCLRNSRKWKNRYIN